MLFEGLIDEQRHKWDDALGVEIDTMRFGAAMMHSEDMVGPLVSIACEAIGRRHAWSLVGHVSPGVARDAAIQIQSMDASLPSAVQFLKSDEVSTEASLIEEFRNPRWREQYIDQAISDSDSTSSGTGAAAFIRHQMIRGDFNSISSETVMKDYTTYTDELLRNAELPYSAYLSAPQPKAPSDAIDKLMGYAGRDYIRSRRESARP